MFSCRSKQMVFLLLVCLAFVVLIVETFYTVEHTYVPSNITFRTTTNSLSILSMTNYSAASKAFSDVSQVRPILQKERTIPTRHQIGRTDNASPKSTANYSRTETLTANTRRSTNNKSDTLTTMKAYKLSTKYGAPEVCSEEYKWRHLMTSDLDGRTGNMLFKLMTLIAAANDSCFTPFIPDKTIDLDKIFNIKNIVRKNISTSHFSRIGESGWGYYQEPIVKRVKRDQNYTISGFRQCYHYFQHKKELVTSSFIFKDDTKAAVDKFFAEEVLNAKIKVGVHVRRGDFVSRAKIAYGYFGSSVEYIHRAMEYFIRFSKISNLTFIFVSDNITWCQEHFRSDNVYFSPFKDPGSDLYILTQCDHNIITTGTFGWMGAWFNETGKVVYDKLFPRFKSPLWQGYRKEDYYPDWWIGL